MQNTKFQKVRVKIIKIEGLKHVRRSFGHKVGEEFIFPSLIPQASARR